MTATDVRVVGQEPPSTDPPPISADERISHRGPMRRWLISPEIGALIGAVIVWAFFWGNGRTFGEADTTLNWLDVAAPTGIMAAAVALLMIGGEFDLSSGVMTGATAIQIGLVSRFFMGTGINIGWAIGSAFLAAAAVGWFNGFMVNKTGLPSFIVTLASFFTLRGVMLVISKRLVGKVQVDQITNQKGAKFFKDWIAHEWKFTEFGIRDKVFLGLVIAGGAAFAYGLLEQSFIRRVSLNSAGLGLTLIGIIAAGAGYIGLLHTDGVGNNALYGVISLAGATLAIVGAALTRWVGRTTTVGESTLPSEAKRRLGLGVGCLVLACLTPIPFDRHQRDAILTWTSPSLRPVVTIVAAIIGVALAIRAIVPQMSEKKKTAGSFAKVGVFAIYSGLLVSTLLICFLQLTTVQALRAIGMLVLSGAGLTFMMLARGIAGKSSKTWQLIIGLLVAGSLVVLGFVIRADSGAVRFRTGLFAAMMIGAMAIAANTLVEFFMEKRTHADAHADRLGKRLQMIGGGAAFIGLIIRLVWSNLTPEHARQVKAAGGTVGQNVLRETVVWWLIVAAIGSYVLVKTKWGNWIFAVGGNKEAARAVGVPANQVKVGLFVTVSLCGCLAGTLIALRYGTVQANQGTGLEFEFIIAAVVGGCLLTGGYGSVIGAGLGSAIMAISVVGVQTTPWNSDGRFAFLGGVLLLAVLVNNFIRKKAQEAR
jgi:ribose/xylose/arabinose/galactoside ABC-type transport system permease subunit